MFPFPYLLRAPRALIISGTLLLIVGWCWAIFSWVEYVDMSKCHKGSAQERRMCYRDYYTSLTEKHGAKIALTDLAQRQSQGTLWNECHELTHAIGGVSARGIRPLPEILAEGNSFCRAGYYHGALAEIIKNQGGLPSQEMLTTLCKGLPGEGTGTGLYRHCSHGVGHGLMFASGGDVSLSLTYCSVFENDADKKECAGGVYMEHFMADGVEHVSKESGVDTTILCKKSPALYQGVCYERAGSEFGSKEYLEPEKSFASCRALGTTSVQSICMGGIGLISIGEEDLSPRDPSKICGYGPTVPERQSCYRGAIETLRKVAPELGDSRAVVCNRILDATPRSECLSSKQ